jgi:thioredoxin-related protein
VDRLEQEWADMVSVVRLNVHDKDARPLLERLGFRFTPTFILFDRQGLEVWRSVGTINPDIVRQEVGRLN